MHANNILVPEQFSFRQGSSTENSAFKLTESVLKCVNQKMHVSGILYDLAKAFEIEECVELYLHFPVCLHGMMLS
jgi:hypothetical protein